MGRPAKLARKIKGELMRILAFSDLHHARARADDLVEASREADLVIGAGDFCNHRQNLPEAINLLAGMNTPFLVVPGNNESHSELVDAAHVGTTVLHGETVELDGVKIFGIGGGVPATPWDWSFDLSEEEAANLLSLCQSADILVTHSPPKGFLDRNSGGLSLGSTAVLEAIERIKPQIVLCGHIHECWGQSAKIGESAVYNLGPTPNWFTL